MREVSCPQCGQAVGLSSGPTGNMATCGGCGANFVASADPPIAAVEPGASPVSQSTPTFERLDGVVCTYCRTPIGSAEPATKCSDCGSAYHEECWNENGGCGVYGCSKVPEVEKRSSIEVPVSFWGQENKPCPACGREILAAALRCRHCGAVFASAQPENTEAFQSRLSLEGRLPKARMICVWVFVLSVLPCTSLGGAIWGLVWYPRHKQEVAALPSIYSVLCKIGIVTGFCQSIALVVLGLLFSAFKS
jgi:predicted RNA-binding Zn-ribbon protein involved in translation (DUF1610 family)